MREVKRKEGNKEMERDANRQSTTKSTQIHQAATLRARGQQAPTAPPLQFIRPTQQSAIANRFNKLEYSRIAGNPQSPRAASTSNHSKYKKARGNLREPSMLCCALVSYQLFADRPTAGRTLANRPIADRFLAPITPAQS
jgi:hypothetical protein